MANPPVLPVLRTSQPITAGSMDCIVYGSDLQLKPQLDQQRYQLIKNANGTLSQTDSKLLWSLSLVPWRSIVIIGANIHSGGSGGPFLFTDRMKFYMANPSIWTNADATEDFVNLTAPKWGHNYELHVNEGVFRIPGFPTNFLVNAPLNSPGFDLDLSWPSSGWNWTLQGGTALPDNPVNPDLIFKIGFLTQILCPDQLRPQNYELWSVTCRNAVIPYGGPLGNVPGPPGPWSLSTDWAKQHSGVIHPGEIITIPCPVDLDPQSPPAPPSFDSPNGYAAWEGWGVDQFIIFTGPAS